MPRRRDRTESSSGLSRSIPSLIASVGDDVMRGLVIVTDGVRELQSSAWALAVDFSILANVFQTAVQSGKLILARFTQLTNLQIEISHDGKTIRPKRYLL